MQILGEKLRDLNDPQAENQDENEKDTDFSNSDSEPEED